MLRYFILIIAACLIFQQSAAESIKEDSFQARLDYVFKQIELNGGLKKGMSCAEVEKVVGCPDNKERNGVWIWVEKNKDDLLNLEILLNQRKKFGRGFFLIFKDDKLETPVPLLISKDWDILLKAGEGSAGGTGSLSAGVRSTGETK